ncbi:class II aldolase/adducin family protein [Candidatus Villigracilis saccharophilus]|uniref:class II aldolase/adducin family protein n=1 Tax=Candidatus Villigracilis saccharophilus TaxID=3140684 RepID=UPI0031363666|nr:class II aldolase/adducin family protein [Anaerolineales bacterium]
MTEIQHHKQQVVDACRTLLERGYLKATEGNISARISGQSAFAVTPSNYDYAKMQVDDICILDFDMHQIEGEMKPSIESGMHAAVYQTRADVHCIIHTHQPYASALALINMPIPALFDEQVRYLGRSVDIISYAPSGTGFLKNAVKAKVKNNNNAFILQNHGVLVFGGTMEQAIHNMALLEKCALTYLLALMTEKKISKIPLPIREIAFAKLRADEKKFAEIK